jgi:hypothetical protein
VQLLLAIDARPYAMFIDHRKCQWMLDVYRYASREDLLASLQPRVISPAEAKVTELHATR